MTPFTSFYDYVLPEIPGVSTDIALQAIRNAAISFCEDSNVDIQTLTTVPMVANTNLYQLAPPSSDYDIALPMFVWANGQKLAPTTLDKLYADHQYWPNDSGTPTEYFQQTQDSLSLYPAPDAATVTMQNSMTNGGVVIMASLRPANAATQMTDWVASKYIRDIANGAKAKLMAMPAKPWSNPEVAKYYAAWYEEGLSNAIADVKRSYTRTSTQVKFPRI